jgi:cholesterol oxidase
MAAVTRRRFIQRSSLLVAGTAFGIGCSNGNDNKGAGGARHAIVIGSGFAGSVTALRLAQAGILTTVLERGQHWQTDSATRLAGSNGVASSNTTSLPVEAGEPLRNTGQLESIAGETVGAQCGSCIGGGSLVYGGVLMQPRRESFSRVLPEISYDEMDSIYYPRVLNTIGAATIPDDVLASPTYESHRVFIADSERAGFEVFRPHTSFDWDMVRQEIAGEIPAQVSIGNYSINGNIPSKLSTDKNYLRDAVASGKAEVRALTEVEMIRELPTGYGVVCVRLSAEGAVLERYELRCTHLFLAAGSMNTSKLLLKSQLAGELKGANDRIGHGWGTNGDELVANLASVPVASPQGGPACIASIDRGNPDYPITSMHSPAPLRAQLQMLMSTPDQLGQLRYDPDTDKVQILWTPDGATPSGLARRDSFQRLLAASGGTEIDFSRFLGGTIWHPLGGTVMGDACDHLGQLYGYRNLFVVDGSLLPGSAAAANPALTVAANAERIMAALVPGL